MAARMLVGHVATRCPIARINDARSPVHNVDACTVAHAYVVSGQPPFRGLTHLWYESVAYVDPV